MQFLQILYIRLFINAQFPFTHSLSLFIHAFPRFAFDTSCFEKNIVGKKLLGTGSCNASSMSVSLVTRISAGRNRAAGVDFSVGSNAFRRVASRRPNMQQVQTPTCTWTPMRKCVALGMGIIRIRFNYYFEYIIIFQLQKYLRIFLSLIVFIYFIYHWVNVNLKWKVKL